MPEVKILTPQGELPAYFAAESARAWLACQVGAILSVDCVTP
jgi:hypothetical protein